MKSDNTSFLRRLYNSHYLNKNIVLVSDVIISVVCMLVAYMLSHFFLDIKMMRIPFFWALLIGGSAIVAFVSIIFSGIHRQIVRYAGFGSTLRLLSMAVFNAILMSITYVGIILFATNQRWAYLDANAKSIILAILLYVLLLACALVLEKASLVYITRRLRKTENKKTLKKRVLIFGVNFEAASLGEQLGSNKYFEVVGYYGNELREKSLEINGKPIYHTDSKGDLTCLKKTLYLDGIIFPNIQSILSEKEVFIADCESIGLPTYVAGNVETANITEIAKDRVRRIKIEDLLMRDQMSNSEIDIKNNYSGKVVLVTGAAGSIGSELSRQLAQLNVKELILFDNAETPMHNIRLEIEDNYPNLKLHPIVGDVRSESRLRMIFERFHPEIVLHAAAYKHVPLMEENPCEAIRVNIIGSMTVADLCVEYEAEKMVMVSTDKAVNPTNVMGATKRAAEIYIQSLGKQIEEGKIKGKTTFITTRFGNVLGSQGSVIHRFREQIEKGGPITVTHPDIVRYFMSIPEACNLVLIAATLGNATQIFVFDMGERHHILKLAERMIRLSGLEPYKDIKIEFTGLRPGEKLYEEVLSIDENTIPTKNQKIKIAKVRDYDFQLIRNDYEQFDQLSKDFKVMESVQLIKKVVPEFKSRNSRFEAIDKMIEEKQKR